MVRTWSPPNLSRRARRATQFLRTNLSNTCCARLMTARSPRGKLSMTRSYSSGEIERASNAIAGLIEIGKSLKRAEHSENKDQVAYQQAVRTYLSALNSTTAYLVKTRADPRASN